jgi:GTP-binding protein
VAEARERRVPTAEVNKVLEALVQHTNPPQKPGQEVKLLYASQVGTAPPVFALVCSRPDAIPTSYERYLINGFRKAWSFEGSPLRLKFKRRSGRNP